MMIAVGILLSVVEFLFVSLVVGKATIVGYQNGLLAGGGVVLAVVVLVWLATFILKPETSPEVASKETSQAPAH